MGCFLGCFGDSKSRRRRRRREYLHPRGNRISEGSKNDDHLNVKVPTVEEVPREHVIPITDISEKVAEKFNRSPIRKRVTFDSNVRTYEHVLQEESAELPKEVREERSAEEKPVKPSRTESSSESSSVTSNSSGSFPPNHRYQNCRESDDERVDGSDCDESDLDDDWLLDEDYYSDDDDDDDGYYQNKLPSYKEVYTEEIADNGLDIEEAKPRGSNASARDRSSYIHPVLNPVDNFTQWKSVKSKVRTIPAQPQKENLNLVSYREDNWASVTKTMPKLDKSSSLSFKPRPRDEPKKTKNRELEVDASLSTWLSESETTSASNGVSTGLEATKPERNNNTPCNSTPIKNHDDRPILGALTVEEIKQFSATSSPRKSPSRSPDEMPIIGSVGGYWNHSGRIIEDRSSATSSYKGIPNTNSKYREDKRVNWDSTPFEARLERALNSGGR
ncbi:PREDICTED: eisosome protein SEG2-like [Tarenaya hassleriana]|uniref:eisosome protein SEG2-like n=1 Tax=Tarenaya hassleriana TaxID=28532 RepID=UPI00053C738C|nr:PREDICTED: eisosome protein SEG2-like [Tarenaya hassleriana]